MYEVLKLSYAMLMAQEKPTLSAAKIAERCTTIPTLRANPA